MRILEEPNIILRCQTGCSWHKCDTCEEEAGWWGGGHCATGASTWMEGRLSFFSVGFCVISECREVSKMLSLSAKNQKGSDFCYFKNPAGSFSSMHFYSPCTFRTENLKTTLDSNFVHGKLVSKSRNTYLMLGRTVAAGGGGESRGGTSYSSFPR